MEGSKDVDLRDIVRFIYTKRLVLLITALIAGAAAYIYSISSSSYYEQQFTFYSTLLSNKEAGPFMDSFEEIANRPWKYKNEEERYLSPEASTALSSFDFGSVAYEQGYLSCNVELVTYDPNYAEEIIQGVIQYMNDQPYLQKRYDLKKEELSYLIEETETEINELKAYKKVNLEDAKNSNGVIGYPINFNSELMLVQESYASYKQQLKLLELFQVLSLPPTPSEPSGPKPIQNGLLAFLVVIVGGIFLIFSYKLFF